MHLAPACQLRAGARVFCSTLALREREKSGVYAWPRQNLTFGKGAVAVLFDSEANRASQVRLSPLETTVLIETPIRSNYWFTPLARNPPSTT